MAYTELAVLYAIQARDPDGEETRRAAPTEADYAEHEAWATRTYGTAAWKAYRKGGWAPSPEV